MDFENVLISIYLYMPRKSAPIISEIIKMICRRIHVNRKGILLKLLHIYVCNDRECVVVQKTLKQCRDIAILQKLKLPCSKSVIFSLKVRFFQEKVHK